VLEEAIRAAAAMGVVAPGSQVVCVQRIHDDFCVKIVAVNERGDGLLPASRASNMAF
jgi:pyruvate kinase